MELTVLLLLVTVPLLRATTTMSIGDGRAMMDEFYAKFNSTDSSNEHRKFDLVFVLDRSDSVPRKIWISTINFVKVWNTDSKLLVFFPAK